ncbi:hypothetical protein D3C79_1123010 [compost metagenome]
MTVCNDKAVIVIICEKIAPNVAVLILFRLVGRFFQSCIQADRSLEFTLNEIIRQRAIMLV